MVTITPALIIIKAMKTEPLQNTMTPLAASLKESNERGRPRHCPLSSNEREKK
jgi:hypothetical protein